MQDKLLRIRKNVNQAIRALKRNVFRSVYFGYCFLLKIFKTLQQKKQLATAVVVLFFIFFSYAQIINQNNNIILSKNANNEDIRLKKVSPAQNQKIKKENHDFQIAALLREDPSPEITLSLNNTALVAVNSKINQNIIPTRTKIETYIVKPNDNPWDIAKKFGLNVYTILWANDLTYWDNIQPGDKLTILPVDGSSQTPPRCQKQKQKQQFPILRCARPSKKVAVLTRIGDINVVMPIAIVIITPQVNALIGWPISGQQNWGNASLIGGETHEHGCKMLAIAVIKLG